MHEVFRLSILSALIGTIPQTFGANNQETRFQKQERKRIEEAGIYNEPEREDNDENFSNPGLKTKPTPRWRLNLDLSSISFSGNSDGALVAFVIIGATFVVLAIPLALSYFAPPLVRTSSKVDGIDKFFDLGVILSRTETEIFDGNSLTAGYREIDMIGMEFKLFFDRSMSTDFGVGLETGAILVNDPGSGSKPWRNFTGSYLMVGPIIYFAKTPSRSFGFLQVVGGASSISELGLLARAELGGRFSFGVDDKFYWQVSIGSTYTELGIDDGVGRPPSSYSYSGGFGFGYRFEE